MAVLTIGPGDMEVQIKHLARVNTASLISDGTLSAADYPTIKGGLFEFCEIMNTVFAQFDTDVTVASLVSVDGESWREVRDTLNTNFALVDAVVNP